MDGNHQTALFLERLSKDQKIGLVFYNSIVTPVGICEKNIKDYEEVLIIIRSIMHLDSTVALALPGIVLDNTLHHTFSQMFSQKNNYSYSFFRYPGKIFVYSITKVWSFLSDPFIVRYFGDEGTIQT